MVQWYMAAAVMTATWSTLASSVFNRCLGHPEKRCAYDTLYYPHMPIGMVGTYRLLFVLFVRKHFVTDISAWVDTGRWNLAVWYTWVGSKSSPSAILVNFSRGVSPKPKKWKNFGNTLLIDRLRVCNLGGRHVGIYASRDNWRTWQYLFNTESEGHSCLLALHPFWCCGVKG